MIAMRAARCLLPSLLALVLATAGRPAEARLTRLEIARVEPAFGGQSFGAVGPSRRLVGRAHGEVDPAQPGNALIQDLHLAPRNARGLVEYATDVDILAPADVARGNGVLLVEVVNRGNKLALGAFDADVPPGAADRNALATAGDGHLLREGYTLVWFGWQADLLPGQGRLTLAVPDAEALIAQAEREGIRRAP